MIDLPPSLLSEEKIAKIESRHNDLCIMYGGEPWDESCVEDGEQAHMDRAALLAHVRAQRPAVTREQIAGEILRSRFEYAPGNIELSNNCDDDIEALKAADAILALSAHLSPQGAGERGSLPERATAAPAIDQLVRLADTAELFLQSTHPDFAQKLRAAVTEASKLIGVKHYAHTKCCRCGADITGQPYRPTDDFDKRVCLVCQPVGLTLSFPIAHEDRDNYKPKPPAAPPQPPEGT